MLKWYRILAAVVPIVLVAAAVTLIFVLTGPTSRDVRQKLVIDHDGGADDAMAIFMAALKERYFGGPQLLALTTTFGNVNEEQAFINSQVILDVADRREVPIYRGSTDPLIEGIESDYYFGHDGLGENGYQAGRPLRAQKQHAAMALVEMAHTYQGNLVIVAIGSLTNIALAMKLDPQFLERVGHLYVGGGHIHDDKNKDAEFNVAMDPEAYHIVTAHGRADKLTLIPFSTVLTHQNITNDWRINVLGAIPSPIMHKQNSFERISLSSTGYWSLLDPAVMAIVLDGADVIEETKDAASSVEICGASRGLTTYDLSKIDNATAKVVTVLKKEPYQDLLFKLFSAQIGKSVN